MSLKTAQTCKSVYIILVFYKRKSLQCLYCFFLSYIETQPTENQQVYDITSPHYEEIGDIHNNEEAGGNNTYEGMEKDNVEEEQYETPHHYLELV